MQFTDIVILALKSLSQPVILLLAMVMACGLFCWAMEIGTSLALGTAAAFAVLVFLPILLRGKNGSKESSQSE